VLRRGETERKGGWRKKERETRGIDVRNRRKGGGGGREERRKEDVPRGPGGLLALSLCFSKLGTPF